MASSKKMHLNSWGVSFPSPFLSKSVQAFFTCTFFMVCKKRRNLQLSVEIWWPILNLKFFQPVVDLLIPVMVALRIDTLKLTEHVRVLQEIHCQTFAKSTTAIIITMINIISTELTLTWSIKSFLESSPFASVTSSVRCRMSSSDNWKPTISNKILYNIIIFPIKSSNLGSILFGQTELANITLLLLLSNANFEWTCWKYIIETNLDSILLDEIFSIFYSNVDIEYSII